MSGSVLPLWVQYFQALGIPIAGALIAGVGAAITYQQLRIARDKLQHDLFDRRYKVFLAARDFLRAIFTDADYSPEALHAFGIGILDAPFLFDKDVLDYLQEIQRHARDMKIAKVSMEQGGANRQRYAEAYHENLRWLVDQFAPLMEKFRPIIGFEKKPRLRWLWFTPPIVVPLALAYLIAAYVVFSCAR